MEEIAGLFDREYENIDAQAAAQVKEMHANEHDGSTTGHGHIENEKSIQIAQIEKVA
jgi:hypothetical protein